MTDTKTITHELLDNAGGKLSLVGDQVKVAGALTAGSLIARLRTTVVMEYDKTITVSQGAAPPLSSAWQSVLDTGAPAVWFDAADTNTITDSGGLVSSVANKGSAGGSATASGADRPGTGATTINSRNVLDFGGTQCLNLSSEAFAAISGAYTAFYMYKNDNAALAQQYIVGASAAGTFRHGLIANGSGTANRLYMYSGGTAPYTPESNLGVIISTMRAQNNSKSAVGTKTLFGFFNGFEPGGYNITRADYPIDAWRIGGTPLATGGRFLGKFLEILVFPRVLSFDEQQIVEGYLANKWGVTASLVAGHPWISANPQAVARKYNSVHWGDSMTGGAYLTTKWVDLLAASAGVVSYNGGFGGQDSIYIKGRFDIDERYKDRNMTIWVGRNNLVSGVIQSAQIKSDIAAMVASLPHSRYFVIGVPKGENEYTGGSAQQLGVDIDTLNGELAALYGEKYLDMQNIMWALGAPGQSYANATSYARNLTPPALMYDGIHWNETAQPYEAAAAMAKFEALGYW